MKTSIFLALLISSVQVLADIQVAVIDTGFCPKLLTIKPNIKIEKVIDLTDSIKEDYCKKFNKSSPRFHGHLVLQTFIDQLQNTQEKIIITPLIVFDKNGKQLANYWQQALKKHYDFILSGAQLMTNEKIATDLQGQWFVAAPHLNPGVYKESIFFPASIAPLQNLFIIGSSPDNGQLYKDKVDYYFPDSTGELRGSSYAVSIAAAKAINLCGNEIKANLRSCLVSKTFK